MAPQTAQEAKGGEKKGKRKKGNKEGGVSFHGHSKNNPENGLTVRNVDISQGATESARLPPHFYCAQ